MRPPRREVKPDGARITLCRTRWGSGKRGGMSVPPVPSFKSLASEPGFPACAVGRTVMIDGATIKVTEIGLKRTRIVGIDLATGKERRFRLAAALRDESPAAPEPASAIVFRARDEAFENSPGIREALDAVDGGAPLVLVTGRAGTGKTKLIRYLRRRPGGERQAVVAPTGVAALNAGAQTIHKLFQLPPNLIDPRELADMKGGAPVLKKMTRLVIDEISMARVDVIDAVDARLRRIREDSRPFGGVQVVMVGDFLQLPPVVSRDEEPLLRTLGYDSPFAFSAHALRDLPVANVLLEKVYRQDEEDFVELLNHVRTGRHAAEAARILNERCCGPHRPDAVPLLLAPTRAAVDRYNREGMERLTGEARIFESVTEGKSDIAGDRLPVPERVELRVGARVMAVRNDPQGRWVNGSLGTAVGFEENGVKVRFDRTEERRLVEVASWESVKQVWNDRKSAIETEVTGAYRQIPLVPAWAVTIHKAQGLTLDDVRLDLGSGAFAPGQIYVALSRVRTMAGLSLARPFRASDLDGRYAADPYLRWLRERRDRAS